MDMNDLINELKSNADDLKERDLISLSGYIDMYVRYNKVTLKNNGW